MARFIAVHTMPMTEDQFNEMFANPPPFPPGIVCNYTWCDFPDGKAFCEWEGPSKESIEQTITQWQMPFDAVYPVRLADWAKRSLEGA